MMMTMPTAMVMVFAQPLCSMELLANCYKLARSDFTPRGGLNQVVIKTVLQNYTISRTVWPCKPQSEMLANMSTATLIA